MKSNIGITLDTEIVSRLRNEDIVISQFINDWLKSYFDSDKDLKKANPITEKFDLYKERNEAHIQLAKVNKRIKEIEKEEKDTVVIYGHHK